MQIPYTGKTVMREAFERMVLPARGNGKAVKAIRNALRRRVGTFKASGWRVVRTGA